MLTNEPPRQLTVLFESLTYKNDHITVLDLGFIKKGQLKLCCLLGILALIGN